MSSPEADAIKYQEILSLLNLAPGEDPLSEIKRLMAVDNPQKYAPIDLHNHFKWCAPGDRQDARWLLMFDDHDRGPNVYDTQGKAIADFQRAEGLGWNVYLFTLMSRRDTQG